MHAETTRGTEVRLLTVLEAAETLRVSRNTVFKLIRAGELVPTRIVGRTLFESTELDRFIAASRDDDRKGPGP